MPDAQTQYVTTIFPQITSLTKVDAVCLLFLLSSTSKLKTVHLQGFWSKTVYLKKTVHLQGFWPKTVYLKCFEIQLKTVYLQGPCSSRPCISRPCCITFMSLLFQCIYCACFSLELVSHSATAIATLDSIVESRGSVAR